MALKESVRRPMPRSGPIRIVSWPAKLTCSGLSTDISSPVFVTNLNFRNGFRARNHIKNSAVMIEDPETFVGTYAGDYIAKYGEEYRSAITDAIYTASQQPTFNPATFNFSKCIAAAVFSRMILPRALWPSERH